MPWFAPSLGVLAASVAARPLRALWQDAAALANGAAQAAQGTGATAVLFPFDDAVLAEAAGRPVDWRGDVPLLAGPPVADVAELEVEEVLCSARAPVAVEAARFLAMQLPVAALVPSPRRLVAQLGGDAGDEDALDAASDVVTGFACRLLEAPATLLVVIPADGARPGVGDEASLRRLGRHYEAEVFLAAAGEAGVAVMAVGGPGGGPSMPPGTQLVLTDRPVRPNADVAAAASIAAAVAGELRC